MDGVARDLDTTSVIRGSRSSTPILVQSEALSLENPSKAKLSSSSTLCSGEEICRCNSLDSSLEPLHLDSILALVWFESHFYTLWFSSDAKRSTSGFPDFFAIFWTTSYSITIPLAITSAVTGRRKYQALIRIVTGLNENRQALMKISVDPRSTDIFIKGGDFVDPCRFMPWTADVLSDST